MDTKVSALVEGAVLAAIATILALLGTFIPPLSVITNFLWTIPIIMVCLRRDGKTGIITFVVALILVSMFSSPVNGLSLALQYGGVALIYGHAFKQKWPAGRTILFGSLGAIVGTIIAILVSFFFMGVDLASISRDMQTAIDSVLAMYKKMGLLDQLQAKGVTEVQLRQTFDSMMKISVSLLPGGMIVSSMLTAVLSFVISRKILQKMRVSIVEIPAFITWRLSWQYIWGVIVALFMLLAGDYFKYPLLQIIGQNILVIYMPVFFIIGIGIMRFFFKKFNVSRSIKMMLLLLGLVQLPMFIMTLAFLGMFDTVFDYRRLGSVTKV
jgi:uncharacterized protein YybS (DUF2232 family)